MLRKLTIGVPLIVWKNQGTGQVKLNPQVNPSSIAMFPAGDTIIPRLSADSQSVLQPMWGVTTQGMGPTTTIVISQGEFGHRPLWYTTVAIDNLTSMLAIYGPP